MCSTQIKPERDTKWGGGANWMPSLGLTSVLIRDEILLSVGPLWRKEATSHGIRRRTVGRPKEKSLPFRKKFAKEVFLHVLDQTATVYSFTTRWHLVFGNHMPVYTFFLFFFLWSWNYSKGTLWQSKHETSPVSLRSPCQGLIFESSDHLSSRMFSNAAITSLVTCEERAVAWPSHSLAVSADRSTRAGLIFRAVGHLLEATTCLHNLNLELLRLLFFLIVIKWFQMLFPAVVSTDFCSVTWITVVFTVVFELSVKLNLSPLLWVSFWVYGEPVLCVPKNKMYISWLQTITVLEFTSLLSATASVQIW